MKYITLMVVGGCAAMLIMQVVRPPATLSQIKALALVSVDLGYECRTAGRQLDDCKSDLVAEWAKEK